MSKPEPPVEVAKAVNWKARLFFIGQWSVFLLVLAGMAQAAWKGAQQLEENNASISQLDFRWAALAGVLFLAGMAPSWIFWRRVLKAMGQPVGVWASLRAFYVSQLGKYIPGKAMVVIMRATAAPQGSDRVVVAVSVFVETLTMMAVGATMSGIIIMIKFSDQTWLVLLAIGLMLASGVPTIPPLFKKVVRILQVGRASGNIEQALSGVTFRLIGEGWVLCAIGWTLFGTSLYASLQAVPGPSIADEWALLPIYIAAISLSAVAGFLSMLPGGLGVREYVMYVLLHPYVGEPKAIFAVIVMRMASMLFEAIFGGGLYLAGLRGAAESTIPAVDSKSTESKSEASVAKK